MTPTKKDKAIIAALEKRQNVLIHVISTAAKNKDRASDIKEIQEYERIVYYYNGRLSGYAQAIDLLKVFPDAGYMTELAHSLTSRKN